MFKMSPDTQYCLYSSFEYLDVTSDLLLGLRLMEVDVDSVFDEGNGNAVTNLNTMYHSWYDRIATDIEKSLLGYYFLTESSTQFNELVTGVKSNLRIMYYGKEYLKEKSMFCLDNLYNQKSNLKQVSKFKDLISVKNLKDAITYDEHRMNFCNNFFVTYKVLTSNIKHSFQEVMFYYHKKYCKSNIRDLFTEDFLNNNNDILSQVEKQRILEKQKKSKKEVHKIFTKSLNVLNKFFGSTQTKSFINKEEIKIEGNLYNYVIINKGSLLKHTLKMNTLHIPFTLKLYNKNWEYLSELCVVFPGSPVLDQVLSVYLMIKSGEEETLLRASNLYGKKSDLIYKEQFLIDIKKVNPKREEYSQQTFVSTDKKEKVLEYKNKYNFKLKEETLKNNKKLIKEKIINVFFKGMGVPPEIQKELINQELCWDEKLDYISVNIPMPEHLDGFYKNNINLLKHNKEVKQIECFNNHLIA